MSNPLPRLSERSLANESGQMAIFVALTFQILFVFFAMVVNVGLIVHDKINLQNSVDLAAYYGAMKQAELLNEIAHINYQIRQDFKLMTWRMRVLGEFGRIAHPSSGSIGPAGVIQDSLYSQADFASICVAHPAWAESRAVSRDQNLCQQSSYTIPNIPQTPVIAPFNAFNIQISTVIDNLRQSFAKSCTNQGQLNWYYTTLLFAGYKEAVLVRKKMIRQIAGDLSADSADFTDRQQASVRSGALQTLKKNLTSSNLDKFSDSEFKTLNSMALGPCGDVNKWLPEISIRPYLMFTDNINSNGCTARPQAVFELPAIRTIMNQLDPTQQLQSLAQSDSADNTNPYHSSLGFEKNPWCVAYYGVQAKTRPRKPFAPFGSPIQIQARAFAEPFGGRIGPWYNNSWTHDGAMSSGPRTDKLTPPRWPLTASMTNEEVRLASMPNYSRFPGDTLGFRSNAALSTMHAFLTQFAKGPGISLQSYAPLTELALNGDALAYDPNLKAAPPIRQAELAVIAPDVFDMTYYSIDADYPSNYFRFSQDTGRFPSFKPISDLGTRFGDATLMRTSVALQIATAMQPTLVDLNTAYWHVRSASHLLTGWTQAGASNYADFPEKLFGTCLPEATPFPDGPALGGCTQGGRVGYSIRHIARDYLLYGGHDLGGVDGGQGPFLNQPPANW